MVDDSSNDGTREIVDGYQKKAGFKVVVQDADLEYDPRYYTEQLKPIQGGPADVVYGSRFLGASWRVAMFWHILAKKLLTLFTNILYDITLTNLETGYKVFEK